MHDKCCILDRSRNTVGFVTQVVPTPTEHKFLGAVGERGGVAHVDQSQPDDHEEEGVCMSLFMTQSIPRKEEPQN